jgi:ribosomal protein S18 acetylase RimI-like enzyme
MTAAQPLPDAWTLGVPDAEDLAQGVAELTDLLRRHEHAARGWATATPADVRMEVAPENPSTRRNVVARDPDGVVRGWGSAHDRAAGRMLLVVAVDPGLSEGVADQVADALFGWGLEVAGQVSGQRGVAVQQVDSGAFAGDRRQHRWLNRHGFAHARTWWQMSRPVAPDEANLPAGTRDGVRIRPVERGQDGAPDEDDLRIVHDVLEASFADHFNSHEETFDEFVSRLREDPGHRWDHWWIAELVDDEGDLVPAGALVGSVSEGTHSSPDGSYVEYLGVLQNARGRGVATSLLRTVIADAAARHRDRVGLEVDADSPTNAEALYTAMGWRTEYVTESWHRNVSIPSTRGEQQS